MSFRRIDHYEDGQAVLDDGSRRSCEAQRHPFSLRDCQRGPVARLVPVLLDGEEFYETLDGGGLIIWSRV